MVLKESKTPGSLYIAIEEVLDPKRMPASNSEDKPTENIETIYNDARTCVLNFRKIYADLPSLPICNPKPIPGLHEIMEWCIEAGEIIDKIPAKMNLDTIQTLISLFEKLKQLPSKFPEIDEVLWNQAKQRAEKIVAHLNRRRRFYKTDIHYSLRNYDNYSKSRELRSIISELSRIAAPQFKSSFERPYKQQDSQPLIESEQEMWNNALKEGYFWRTVHEIFKFNNAEYIEAISMLENEIHGVISEINTLTCEKNFDAYDTLKGLSLGDLFEKTGRLYMLDEIIDTVLFGPNNIFHPFREETRESIVDEIIQKLKEIKIHVKNVASVETVSAYEVKLALVKSIRERISEAEGLVANRPDVNKEHVYRSGWGSLRNSIIILIKENYTGVRLEQYLRVYEKELAATRNRLSSVHQALKDLYKILKDAEDGIIPYDKKPVGSVTMLDQTDEKLGKDSNMIKIFISHSSKDNQLAKCLIELLRNGECSFNCVNGLTDS